MTRFVINNREFTVETAGRNLLEVCLSLGFNVPYFCWHPAFRSVGACRQCAVKVFKNEKDTRGRIEMSCMIPVTEGMRVSIDDPDAVAFRAKVIEWLMVNHPHDCPVCDEGGECHLQDMTVMTGRTYRRYRFKKRTHRDQNLGPFVNMEMNRCIQCYRCVRFYRDYAGGRDFDVLGWHDHVYFGRHEEGTLASEFSGNLVEVCPTGVFTDKTLKRHYTRKWDLQTAPSICVHCGLGCNTVPGERYGSLRRVHARFNNKVNGYFLCDRGRYGYEFVNSDRRIREPLMRELPAAGGGASAAPTPAGPERQTPAPKDMALKRVAEWLRGGRAIGIGSPRASLEANFALQRLVGSGLFFPGISTPQSRLIRAVLDIARNGSARTPSLHEVEGADAVLVLGEDVTNTAPMLDLAVRQSILRTPRDYANELGVYPWDDGAFREAIQDQKGFLFLATPGPAKLDEKGTGFRAAPADLARLGFAVAHEIDPSAPAVADLDPGVAVRARDIAAGLQRARNPLVISGTGCGSREVIEAAANVAWALTRRAGKGSLCFAVPDCNSLGLAILSGGNVEAAAVALKDGRADTLIVLESDLYRLLDAGAADALFAAARHVVAIDHLASATTARADVVLPAATFAESTGTLVNNEGRAQRFFQVFAPQGAIQPSWRWIADLMAMMGAPLPAEDLQPRDGGNGAHGKGSVPWHGLDDLTAELARTVPDFKDVQGIAPPAGFRAVGQKIPRQPSRYSGREAMTAHLDVHEPKPSDDPDSPMAFSMEGYDGEAPAPLIPRFWAAGWNSVQAVNKFQIEVGGPLHGGDTGRRLIEPVPDSKERYFADIPAPFAPREGWLLISPAWRIFGSEELSALAPGVAAQTPEPYLAVHPREAERLRFAEGALAVLSLVEAQIAVAIRIDASMPVGVGAFCAGLPGQPFVALPAWGRLEKGGRVQGSRFRVHGSEKPGDPVASATPGVPSRTANREAKP